MGMQRARRPGSSQLRLALRLAGAGLLIAAGAIHLDLYVTGYRSIPVIGWLFLFQVIAAFVLAVVVLASGSRLAAAAARTRPNAIVAAMMNRVILLLMSGPPLICGRRWVLAGRGLERRYGPCRWRQWPAHALQRYRGRIPLRGGSRSCPKCSCRG
jgi:hypothetical protein